MTLSKRSALLQQASAKKLRAARLRALGSDEEQFDVTSLFREAAQKELEALALLENPSEQEQAGTRIEACGMFLEAKDPVRAAQQWAQLPRWVFSAGPGRALLDRIEPVFRQQRDAFSERWRSLFDAPGAVRLPARASSLYELERLAQDYPGVPELWWALARRTDDKTAARVARDHMMRLDASLETVTDIDAVLRRVDLAFVQTLRIEMKAEDKQHSLLLDSVSGIAAAFGELLSSFVEEIFDQEIELRPSSASTGSFILDVDVRDLPPHALMELDQMLPGEKKLPGGKRRKKSESTVFPAAIDLLNRLQKDGVRLAVSMVQPDVGEARRESHNLVINAERRRSLLGAAEVQARAHIDSLLVPQADDLTRVFRIVEQLSEHKEIRALDLEITPRQVSYYLHASRILGLVTESGKVTPAGRVIALLTPDERLRATVVHFESSVCGEAWIQWSKGRTLLDVAPDTAFDFIAASVPDLSEHTARRRAQTLMSWYNDLIPYHYARPDAPRPSSAGRA
jgi:hypothetical protein